MMLGNGLLLISALAFAVLLFRRSETLAAAPRSQLQVSSLGLVFVALAAMGQLLLISQSQDIATLQRLLDNLAVYAGLPLLVTATLALAMGWYWSKAGWGRWLLALFALFELCRRMGLGEEYTLWLGIAMTAALLAAAWNLRGGLARMVCALSAPLLPVGLGIPALMRLVELPEAASRPALAVGLLLLSGALLQQTAKGTTAQ